MSTMADTDDYRRMYGGGGSDDMGYGAPPVAPPSEYEDTPRRHRPQRRGSVTERMTYVPDSYVQPSSYSTRNTRSYGYQDFMREQPQQQQQQHQVDPSSKMDYGYGYGNSEAQANGYGYEYSSQYGYETTPEVETTTTTATLTTSPSPSAAPAVESNSPPAVDYGYDTTDYGYDTTDYGYEATDYGYENTSAEVVTTTATPTTTILQSNDIDDTDPALEESDEKSESYSSTTIPALDVESDEPNRDLAAPPPSA